MRQNASDHNRRIEEPRVPQATIERLIRVRADRRGKPVELRVHYEKASFNGCQTYQVLAVEILP